MELKVLFLLHDLKIGGAERFTIELARELSRIGCQCEIVTIMGAGPLRELISPGVALRVFCFFLSGRIGKLLSLLFAPFLFLAGAIRLALYLRRRKPDVVQTSLWMGDVLGILATRLAGISRIVSVQHDTILSAARRKRLFLSWARKVVAVSNPVATFLRKEMRVEEDRIVVIPTGIETNRLESCRSYLQSPPRLAVIGRLHPLKGQRVLLQALALLKAEYSPSCVLLGSGPDEHFLKRRITELGLQNIHILPETTDICPVLKNCDVLVVPSLAEGLGLSIMEAMAAEKIIVASKVGGITDLLKDGENAILFPPGDSVALSRALSFVLKNPGEAVNLARKARQSLLERPELTAEEMSRNYLTLYRELEGS